MSIDIELLPCPFCGSEAQTDFIEGESYLIECYVCRAETGIKDSAEEAIAAWNRRATPQAPTPAAPEGQAEAWLKYNLRELLGSLPMRRDWLNPDVERELRAIESEISSVAAPLPRQAAVQGEWISVADRLPKCSKKPDSLGIEVIIYPMPEKGKSTAFFGCRLTSAPSFYKYGSRIEGVTHWMSLPAAPQAAPDQAKSAPATTGKESK